MAQQLYFEDVKVGTEIPALAENMTTRQMVRWAVATQNMHEVHYDKNVAIEWGFPEVVVHGRLKLALVGKMLIDWIGQKGALRKLSGTYRGVDYPGKLSYRGTVTKKYVKDGEHHVEADVWVENAKGDKTILGAADMILPSSR